MIQLDEMSPPPWSWAEGLRLRLQFKQKDELPGDEGERCLFG